MPSLIVIDPLFRNMVGSDSDPKDMSAFIWAATKLQAATKATVVILHTPAGLPTGNAGSRACGRRPTR